MFRSNLWIGWIVAGVCAAFIVLLLVRGSSKPRSARSMRPRSYQEAAFIFGKADTFTRIYLFFVTFWPEDKKQQVILYSAFAAIALTIFGANHPGPIREFLLAAYAVLYKILKGQLPPPPAVHDPVRSVPVLLRRARLAYALRFG